MSTAWDGSGTEVPQQGPSLIQRLVTIFVRCDDGGACVCASVLCLLEINSERAAVEGGVLTTSSFSLCQQVKGWAGGAMNHRCRVTRQAREQGFRPYWGLSLTTKGSQLTRCRLLHRGNLHINQSRWGVTIWWGKGARSQSLLIAEPSVNLQLGKKNQSRQRNARTKAWWLRGRSGLPKSEASSFKSSFSCYWVGGGGDSLYFLNICYCGKRITIFFFILLFNFSIQNLSWDPEPHIQLCTK